MSPLRCSRELALITCLLLQLIMGCGYTYTQVVDPTLANRKLGASTIAVVDMPILDYRPPASCITVDTSPAQQSLGARWNDAVRAQLPIRFPQQRFRFISAQNPVFNYEEFSFSYVQMLAMESQAATLIHGTEAPAPNYQNMPESVRMTRFLKYLREKENADIAVFMLTPSLVGSTSTSTHYTAGVGGRAGTTSSSTVVHYTADVKLQVWDCASGQLVYSSGAWEMASSGCAVISPSEMAVDRATVLLIERLSTVITQVLYRYEYLQVSR